MGNKGSEFKVTSPFVWNQKGPNYFKYENRTSQQNNMTLETEFMGSLASFCLCLIYGALSVEAFYSFFSISRLTRSESLSEPLQKPPCYLLLSCPATCRFHIYCGQMKATLIQLLCRLELPNENRGLQGFRRKVSTPEHRLAHRKVHLILLSTLPQ